MSASQFSTSRAGVLHISTRFVLQFQQKIHSTINPKSTIDSYSKKDPQTTLGRPIFPAQGETHYRVHQNYKLRIIFN
uniref:Uncharacterized protein n=1 Tax=Setaria italica TaxID=4555 RepID=K3ZYP1_SETIT